jgi:hypothetical protein
MKDFLTRIIKGSPKYEELISRLEGTQCRGGTSCPDQLAKAVKEALAQ